VGHGLVVLRRSAPQRTDLHHKSGGAEKVPPRPPGPSLRVTNSEAVALSVRRLAGYNTRTCDFHLEGNPTRYQPVAPAQRDGKQLPWGKIKLQTLKAIAEWLAKQLGTTIFGIDANCPKSDHPDRTLNEWWWDDDPTLLGPNPLHALEDVLRAFLRRARLAEITLQRPLGPLAVSHCRGKGKDNRYS